MASVKSRVLENWDRYMDLSGRMRDPTLSDAAWVRLRAKRRLTLSCLTARLPKLTTREIAAIRDVPRYALLSATIERYRSAAYVLGRYVPTYHKAALDLLVLIAESSSGAARLPADRR